MQAGSKVLSVRRGGEGTLTLMIYQVRRNQVCDLVSYLVTCLVSHQDTRTCHYVPDAAAQAALPALHCPTTALLTIAILTMADAAAQAALPALVCQRRPQRQRDGRP